MRSRPDRVCSRVHPKRSGSVTTRFRLRLLLTTSARAPLYAWSSTDKIVRDGREPSNPLGRVARLVLSRFLTPPRQCQQP